MAINRHSNKHEHHPTDAFLWFVFNVDHKSVSKMVFLQTSGTRNAMSQAAVTTGEGVSYLARPKEETEEGLSKSVETPGAEVSVEGRGGLGHGGAGQTVLASLSEIAAQLDPTSRRHSTRIHTANASLKDDSGMEFSTPGGRDDGRGDAGGIRQDARSGSKSGKHVQHDWKGKGKAGSTGDDRETSNETDVSIRRDRNAPAVELGRTLSALTEAFSSSRQPPFLLPSSQPGASASKFIDGGRGSDCGVTTFEAEESGVLRALLRALLDGRHSGVQDEVVEMGSDMEEDVDVGEEDGMPSMGRVGSITSALATALVKDGGVLRTGDDAIVSFPSKASLLREHDGAESGSGGDGGGVGDESMMSAMEVEGTLLTSAAEVTPNGTASNNVTPPDDGAEAAAKEEKRREDVIVKVESAEKTQEALTGARYFAEVWRGNCFTRCRDTQNIPARFADSRPMMSAYLDNRTI